MSLNREDHVDIWSKVESFAGLKDIIPIIDFKTFSDEMILKHFHERAGAAGLSADQVNKDINDIVIVGLERGNFRLDMLRSVKESERKRITELIHRYQIETTKSGGESSGMRLDRKTMTFVRSLQVFPVVASRIIMKGDYKPVSLNNKFSSNDLPGPMKHRGFAAIIPRMFLSNDLPGPMMHMGFPATIPRISKLGGVFFTAFVAYMIEFSYHINPRKMESDRERYKEQKRFSNYAWENTLVPYNRRITLMDELGLGVASCLPPIVACANALRKAMGEEPFSFDELIKDYTTDSGKIDFEKA